MIRTALFTDIPRMERLLQRAYDRSRYAKDGIVKIKPETMRSVLITALGQHNRDMFVQVAENGAAITGMIIGALQPVCLIGDKLTATDLFWISDGGEARDARTLMMAMLGWAWLNPQVIEVQCATHTVILEDAEAAGRILHRLGFAPVGNIYRMERK